MRNFSMAGQMMGTFAFSCATNGIGVAIVTLAVLVWNARQV
jgi:hypothetical protein